MLAILELDTLVARAIDWRARVVMTVADAQLAQRRPRRTRVVPFAMSIGETERLLLECGDRVIALCLLFLTRLFVSFRSFVLIY